MAETAWRYGYCRAAICGSLRTAESRLKASSRSLISSYATCFLPTDLGSSLAQRESRMLGDLRLLLACVGKVLAYFY